MPDGNNKQPPSILKSKNGDPNPQKKTVRFKESTKNQNQILSFHHFSLAPFYPTTLDTTKSEEISEWTRQVIEYASCVEKNDTGLPSAPKFKLAGKNTPMTPDSLRENVPELMTAIQAIQKAEQSDGDKVTLFGMDPNIMTAFRSTSMTEHLLNTPKVSPWISDDEISKLSSPATTDSHLAEESKQQDSMISENNKQNIKPILEESFSKELIEEAARMQTTNKEFADYANTYQIVQGPHPVQINQKRQLDAFIQKNNNLIPENLSVKITMDCGDCWKDLTIKKNPKTTLSKEQVQSHVLKDLINQHRILHNQHFKQNKVNEENYVHTEARTALRTHYNAQIENARNQIAEQLKQRPDLKFLIPGHTETRKDRINDLIDTINESMMIPSSRPVNTQLANIHLQKLQSLIERKSMQTKEVAKEIKHHLDSPIVQALSCQQSVQAP